MSQSDTTNSTPSEPPTEAGESPFTAVPAPMPARPLELASPPGESPFTAVPAPMPARPLASPGSEVYLRLAISERVLVAFFTAIAAIYGATVVL